MTVIISGTDGVSDVDGTAGTPALRGTDANTGIFFPAADTIAFAEGGAEAMRIDSSGNVGIGTTTPGTRMSLQLSSATTYTTSTRTNQGLTIFNSSPTTNQFTGIEFVGEPTSGNGGFSGIGSVVTGSGSAALVFGTRDASTYAERMRIDSSGNLLVGKTTTSTTTAGNAIGPVLVNFVASTASPSDGPQIQIGNIAASVASGYRYISFRVNAVATEVGSITTNGSSSTAYGTSSDYRLKENIAPMAGALAIVAQINPVTYTWKADGAVGQGFIAHELQEVVPDCVIGEKDAVETYTDEDGNDQTRPKYQNVDTSFLVATLTAAIQELKAINDAQASRIETLEAKVAALEAQ